MRSRVRTLCLAGLAALLASCGGGEEARGILAVAFRLDEGSPALSAYAGDPDEDPFWLPAGHYYIETMDHDGIVSSLGTIYIEAGKPVSFPSSVSEGGGTPDPEAAEPLLTIANFVIEADLAEYAYLEIVTSGYQLSPYDPDIEVSEEAVVALIGTYLDLLAQKDGLLAALGEVEERAQVSDPAQYVHTPRKPARQGLDQTREEIIAAFLGLTNAGLPSKDLVGEYVKDRQAEIVLLEQTHWIVTWIKSTYAQIGQEPGLTLKKTTELVARHNEWETYARELAGEIEDEASEQRARERLTDRIATDFEDWIEAQGGDPEDVDMKKISDQVADYFVKELLEAVIGPAAAAAATPTPTPTVVPGETPTPALDTNWIEGYVQGIADQWLAAGYGGIDVVVAADDLRQCLADAVQGGAGRDQAIGECPTWLFEPQGSPEPTAAPTPTPAPTQPGVPVVATGSFDFGDLGSATLTENTVSLTWNSAGGPIISGSGRWRMEAQHFCGTEWQSWNGQYSGTFDPASNTLSGSYSGTLARLNFHRESDGSCVQDPSSDTSTGSWTATLSGSTVAGEGPNPFHATVGGAGAARTSGVWTTSSTTFLLDSHFATAIPSASRMPLLRLL